MVKVQNMCDIKTTNAIQVHGPKPAASVSPRELLEMHILRLHPSPAESESLEVEPKNLWFNKPSS